MSTAPIPPMYDALVPSVIVSDAAKAIEFYKAVFGAEEIMRMHHQDGVKIAHAELKIRGHILMLGDECPQMGAIAPKPGEAPHGSITVYFENADAVYARALQQGATPNMPPMDMFWGDRYAKFLDPFGHLWGVATHIRDVTPEECAAAMASWGKPKPE